jgi:flagellar basal body rod protein FlgG
MNYGLYLSASGVLTNTYRQDVFANNLANVETVGFKRDVPTIRQRDAEAIEKNFGSELRKQMLDKLGGGVWAGTQRTDFAPAPMRPGQDNDAALTAPDTFFAVETRGANGQTGVALTRDGRFSVDAEGYLVTASGGRVLNASDDPILLEPEPFEIGADGSVQQRGQRVDQIQITAVTDTRLLQKAGGNRYTWDAAAADPRKEAPSATVRPRFIEASGVDPVIALTELMEATKAITANANMIRYHDQMLERAVNTLGRVA